MLVDPDLHPHQTIYYTTGLVMRVLTRLPSAHFDLATVYQEVLREQEETSLDSVILALDYLHLLGIVGMNDVGELTCS